VRFPGPTHQTHFVVKMLDWSAARESKLFYRCRRRGRNFCHFTVASHDVWGLTQNAERRKVPSAIDGYQMSAPVRSAPGMMRTESNRPSPERIHSFFSLESGWPSYVQVIQSIVRVLAPFAAGFDMLLDSWPTSL
jgi:hypothetical protein